jgi:Zn-dependent protease
MLCDHCGVARRRGSIKLMDLFGFRIGVDISWFLILFLMIFWLSGDFRSELHSSDGVAYLTAVITAFTLFASLIVHELGHAVVARREGIEVTRIELLLFGGITQMSRDAANPGEDFRIAVAGPLATVGFVIACLIVDLIAVGPHKVLHAAVLDSSVRVTPVTLCLTWLLVWNILLLAFNLVPAFPLDGGRIARSAVWRVTGSKQRGTRVAAKLGQGFAVLLGGVGLWLMLSYGAFTGLWLIGVAFLLGQSARAALVQTAFSERIESVRVADIMDHQPVAIPSRTPVAEAEEDFFMRYGWAWFPVVDDAGRLVGIVRHEGLRAARGDGQTVAAALESDGPRVGQDEPLTEILASDGLRRLGAVPAVDGDGVLRGVVTAGQVRRALQSVFGAPAA